MGVGLELWRTDPDDGRLISLIRELDTFLHAMDGDVLHERVSPYNKLESGTKVVLAVLDGSPIGCGALRLLDSETGEIKRMFVRPEARGQQVGRAILGELESWARELELSRVILETVLKLEAAVGLYRSQGYQRIPNYPPYTDISESACFEKKLR